MTNSPFLRIHRILWAGILVLCFSWPGLEAQSPTAAQLISRFQSKLESAFDEVPESVGILVHVEAPEWKLSWSSAVGVSNQKTGKKLVASQPVLLASNTKPYVAASLIRLVEQGHVKLDDPIAKHLDAKTIRLFENDGYKFSKIQIQHLLSHTSGICDYVDDDYFDWVGRNPKYQWHRREQLERSVRIGKPLFRPGQDHKYGDVNYLLLTQIIEKITRQPFHLAIPKLLKFDAIGLKQTWFEGLTPRPKSALPLAHQYAASRQWDSYRLNPSWDLYGGGGLAANAKDAALFMQYFFNHKIVEKHDLVDRVTQRIFPKEKTNYCLGVSHFQFEGFRAFYHGGWWGTDVAYCPEANCSVAVFCLERSKRDLFSKLGIDFMKTLSELKSAKKQQ